MYYLYITKFLNSIISCDFCKLYYLFFYYDSDMKDIILNELFMYFTFNLNFTFTFHLTLSVFLLFLHFYKVWLTYI